jgi:class 3 adenylate cyclase/pimeloyl-ACP methyl ester carboxylesterase
MEPEIRYVRSADGTRIAMWTLGAGPPVVCTPGNGFGTMQIGWEFPGLRATFELLAQRRTVIAYDHRGFGFSDHDPPSYSQTALTADLAAVADTLGDVPFDLLGRATGGIPAIAYAVHSSRVRRLALVYTAATGREFRLNARRRALAPLIEVDFELYCQTMALVDFGWTELGRRAAEMVMTIKPEAYVATWKARREWDVRDQLARLRCPTLVAWYDSAEHYASLDSSRQLAAAIPEARLLVFKGQPMREVGDGQRLGRELLGFFDGAAARAAATPVTGTATILFADIAESTALTERLGDAEFRDRARALDERLRGAVRAAGGTPIEGRLLGDGVLAVFSSARQAIAAAHDCVRAGADAGLPLHLGLHAGDVLEEDGNIYGGAVNIAARMAALAAPGEVVVSDTVRGLARTSAGSTFSDRGAHTLKGIAEPLRVWVARPAP